MWIAGLQICSEDRSFDECRNAECIVLRLLFECLFHVPFKSGCYQRWHSNTGYETGVMLAWGKYGGRACLALGYAVLMP